MLFCVDAELHGMSTAPTLLMSIDCNKMSNQRTVIVITRQRCWRAARAPLAASHPRPRMVWPRRQGAQKTDS
eukprot:1983916-Alexandrium_andersonii.AAC.1